MGLFSKKTEEQKQQEQYIKNFGDIASFKVGDYILYSETTDEVIINKGILSPGKQQMFKLSDARSFEVIRDGEKSATFGAGSALGGALLLGPVGLLGGLLFKKKATISDLRVRINTIGDVTNRDIILINTKTKAEGLLGKVGFQSVEQIVEFFSNHFANLEENEKQNASVGNNLEQLRQLKELLDMGAITQDEFDKKKADLL